MKKPMVFGWLFALCLFVSACSSPESDGKKAAERFNDCQNDYVEAKAKAYTSFIDDFASQSFETRVEARENLNSIIQAADKEFERNFDEANAYRDKLLSKYRTNREETVEFQYAFDAQFQPSNTNDAEISSLQDRVDRIIQTIIPPKPDLEKLKHDLVGRKIDDAKDGYHQKGWHWEIESPDELKDVEILNETKSGDDYIYEVHILLQGEFNQYEADVKITYVLRQYDDWSIEFLGTEDMQIVRTHKYDNYITARRTGWSGELGVEFTNRCDVPLVVAGKALTEFGNEWKTFVVVVDANSTKEMGGLFFSIKDYNIHFIERP